MKEMARAIHRGLGILAAALATFYGSWILGCVAIGVAVLTEYSFRWRLRAHK